MLGRGGFAADRQTTERPDLDRLICQTDEVHAHDTVALVVARLRQGGLTGPDMTRERPRSQSPRPRRSPASSKW